jgi:hypothetical protein
MVCLSKQMAGKTEVKIITRDEELLTRAMHAFFVAARKNGLMFDQPSNSSGVQEFAGKRYVILQNANGVLAIYRVRNDGMLKRLRRWPDSLVRTPVASETVRKSANAARRAKRR